MEQQAGAAWAGQLQEYTVSLDARDPDDAARRVGGALEGHGSYEVLEAERL